MARPWKFVSFFFFAVLVHYFIGAGCTFFSGNPRILVFNNEENALHASTPVAIEALRELCDENGIDVDVKDIGHVSTVFTEKGLRRYAAVIFLNTAGNMLSAAQETQFKRYIQAGGGFVGIHTAVDTEHGWKWYGQLTGARFSSRMEIQDAVLRVETPDHPATQHFDSVWHHRDEWFNLHDLAADAQVLLTLDENSCQGGTMGASHPVSWRRTFEGGRVFITTLGHTKEAYSDPAFLQHLLGGIQYAIGENRPLRYENIPPAPPEEPAGTGFVKTSVECDLDEPMALDMLPDGKIVFIERKGAVKLYDPAEEQVRVVGQLPVYIINELGLLGMALDPQWEKNHWIYLYYSEPGEKEVNRLSRFVFTGDSLHRNTETVLLEIGIQREECCHYAGCVRFDGQGYLYLSVGDNTDYLESEGYSPVDERPGYDTGDAQRSAANSMDLRGKILRIKPLPDGSYLCPAGNMFTTHDVVVSPFAQTLRDNPLWMGYLPADPSGNAFHSPAGPVTFGSNTGGQPEIYVMGCRNPFRISTDSRRGLLFWGDPGPQAGAPDSTRGPEGFDEINCARAPGFFGWPYFIGNNKAYRKYDFERKKPGAFFDPQYPQNNSPRNTGIQNLPPAQPALIWYPYSSSPEFPLLANGANCAMAGPVYYGDQYPAESRFPDEYDGNLIIYDWVRNWIVAVSLDSMGRFGGLKPLAESVSLSRPVDMMFDKNGSLWVLEYGTKWFEPNPDACLSRIDYVRGNGAENKVASASVRWDFGGRNRSFYQPGDHITYQVQATDPQSGSLENGGILPGAVSVQIDYAPASAKTGGAAPKFTSNRQKTALQRGETLVNASDCKVCHDAERQVNGPSYQAIAARYAGDKTAVSHLAKKIIIGGTGVWGDRAMSAHPQLKEQEVLEMVRWILSLNDPANRALPLKGAYTLTPPASAPATDPGLFVFNASYTGKPAASGTPRTATETLVLRHCLQQAERADQISRGARVQRLPGNNAFALDGLTHKSFFAFQHLDLHGIKSIALRLSATPKNTGVIELHLDAPDGRLLGSAAIPSVDKPGATAFSEVLIPADRSNWPNDGAFHDLYFVIRNDQQSSSIATSVDWVRFNL